MTNNWIEFRRNVRNENMHPGVGILIMGAASCSRCVPARGQMHPAKQCALNARNKNSETDVIRGNWDFSRIDVVNCANGQWSRWIYYYLHWFVVEMPTQWKILNVKTVPNWHQTCEFNGKLKRWPWCGRRTNSMENCKWMNLARWQLAEAIYMMFCATVDCRKPSLGDRKSGEREN